jgi:2-haloacid dehalogenase
MSYAIGLDVYGTLIDPLKIAGSLGFLAGQRSNSLAQLWREKQLEYSFRRALMRDYQSFDICTDQALQYAVLSFGLKLAPSDKSRLLEQYRKLPPYVDTVPGVQALHRQGHALFAFSNGVEATVRHLLDVAGVLPLLDGVVSVDDLRTFKPNPTVYDYLVTRSQQAKTQTWVVSGNAFDVLGAKAAGLRAAWVKRRDDAVFDPWGVVPDLVIANLRELADALG